MQLTTLKNGLMTRLAVLAAVALLGIQNVLGQETFKPMTDFITEAKDSADDIVVDVMRIIMVGGALMLAYGLVKIVSKVNSKEPVGSFALSITMAGTALLIGPALIQMWTGVDVAPE